ncbi:MAG: AbrB/MazE/SpoVT family DNA-binding domain-containing protein [Clostridiales bacterium]|jgi:AbrB family looped-hinge helix DNA binding protein|nr:AbrB/MazE/SpoVT family DNA-binding domain-containing protein [Clostridiales bacterium]
MQTARVTPDGQIRLPANIRKLLNINDGGRVAITQRDNYIIIENASIAAIDEVRNAYKGAAEELGIETEEDIVNLVKEYRKSKNV